MASVSSLGSRIVAVRAPPPTAQRASTWRPVRFTKAYSYNKSSFDSDDDLDRSLADELAALTNPDKFRKVAENLELTWKITKNRRRQGCDCCRGSGLKECNWCHGTGVFTLGDVLLVSSTGTRDCPVCRGEGEVKCQHCKGTGHIAGWMDPGCPVGSLDDV